MKNIYLLTILLVSMLSTEAVMSQVDVQEKNGDFLVFSQVKTVTTRVMDKEVYKGNIHLYDNWRYATFHHSDFKDVAVDSVKLNIFRGEVEIYQGGQFLTLDNKEFDSFDFGYDDGDFKALYKTKHYYFDNDVRLPGIIKVIELGDYSVIVAYISSVRKDSDKNPLMMESYKKDKVVLHKHRYIEKDGVLSRIKSKKDFKKFFSDYPSAMKLISSQKLNHKEEGDIARAVLEAFGTD